MAEASQSQPKKSPVCLIVLGMAGSGKTTLVQRLSLTEPRPYVLNLDPACYQVPYNTNIDIRDTINYKEVMKQYKLGPNGGIVTALNLFSTKFHEVLGYIEKSDREVCVLDTPGQIEVFTWSVSGTIITETLASTFPTVVLYVVDTARSTNPVVFMSNMLYACSILYKSRLPFIVVMNKTDVVDWSYAVDWMKDFNAFSEALDAEEGYVGNLTRRTALTLQEFYENLMVCGVSANTGDGFDELYELIEKAKVEYETDYRAEWEKTRVERCRTGEPTEKKEIVKAAETNDITDMYLRHPGDGTSSEDSEGEEVHPAKTEEDAELAETFKKVIEQQKVLQIKRAKEAETRRTKKGG